MIREIATRKGSDGTRGILLILAIAILIIFMSSVVGYFENKYDIKGLEYIIYVVLIVICYFVVQHFIVQYRYSLFDDELLIEKMLGKRTTPMVDVFIWDILSFEKVNSSQKVKVSKSYRLFADSTNKWFLTFKKGEEIFEAVFSPSEEFVAQLNSAISNRQVKEEREPDIIT